MGGKVRFDREFALLCGRIVARAIDPYVERLAFVGSFRRLLPDLGDIDILLIPRTGIREDRINAVFAGVCIDGKLDTKGVGMSKGPVDPDGSASGDRFAVPPVNLFFTREDSWGAAMMYTTGSRDYNIAYRGFARKHYGLTVNQRGVFRKGRWIPGSGRREVDVCRAIHIPWLPPQDRSARRLFPGSPVSVTKGPGRRKVHGDTSQEKRDAPVMGAGESRSRISQRNTGEERS